MCFSRSLLAELDEQAEAGAGAEAEAEAEAEAVVEAEAEAEAEAKAGGGADKKFSIICLKGFSLSEIVNWTLRWVILAICFGWRRIVCDFFIFRCPSSDTAIWM